MKMVRGFYKYYIVFVAVFLVLGGCVSQTSSTGGEDWKDIELRDVVTGNSFKISDFEGSLVLIESFAVWCPTCGEQQRRIKEMVKKGEGEHVIHVSLDTDPNEDEEAVKEHVERNGFDWYYAVSPIELTSALVKEYGLEVVNAPSVPMILICEDGSTRYLKSGLKTSTEILAEVEKGC